MEGWTWRIKAGRERHVYDKDARCPECREVTENLLLEGLVDYPDNLFMQVWREEEASPVSMRVSEPIQVPMLVGSQQFFIVMAMYGVACHHGGQNNLESGSISGHWTACVKHKEDSV